MTFRMAKRKAQVSEKVNMLYRHLRSFQIGSFTSTFSIFIIVELMVGDLNSDSYDYSSSIKEASSCLVILISTAFVFSSMRSLN
jgi:hypothetical protein